MKKNFQQSLIKKVLLNIFNFFNLINLSYLFVIRITGTIISSRLTPPCWNVLR